MSASGRLIAVAVRPGAGIDDRLLSGPQTRTADPPSSRERRSCSPEGQLAGQVELKLKTPWRDGTTHLVMSPLEFMQRLAALVQRPRLHLISLVSA
jgi:hypothetical protein